MATTRLWVASYIVVHALRLGVPAYAQLSPGPLSRAHRQLDGVTHCGTCHDFGLGSRAFKCLECHGEIQRRVQTGAGFHGRAYKNTRGQTDCARCHMEHNGEGFALIRLERKGFDHFAQTGFLLLGKHREQSCQSCHAEKRIPVAARAEIKVKDLNTTFLGLRQECTFCHEDQHGGQLGAQCSRCHSLDAWKPAQGFSHASTHFPLTGLHQSVACQKCHGPKPGTDKAQFSGLAFKTCQDCHNDPHHAAFQQTGFRGSCESCHNTNGWKNSRPSAGFTHSTTKFPLTGKHAERACQDCHKSSNFRRPIAHDRCQDCHQDPHSGQFATRAGGSDCSACHSDSGFKPARFDREMHSHTAFPLEGKHAMLQCAKCHPPRGRDTQYVTGKRECSDCHTAAHSGEFAAAPYDNRCNICHTVEGFQTTTFSVERHAETRFALTGRHASVPCVDCHKPLVAAGVAPAWRQYHFPSETCDSCHTDPHRTKIACETCHTPTQWKEVRPFDHTKTGFLLAGAHDVKCVDCHKPPGPVFSTARSQCSTCHATDDVHAGQFNQPERQEECSLCHTPLRWKSGDFNHERTRFPLDVAHRNVDCAKCHKAEISAAGKTIRKFRGTPAECVKCH